MIAAVVEAKHDNKGIVWPKSIAPYMACIINLCKEKVSENVIYQMAEAVGQDVVYDGKNTL